MIIVIIGLAPVTQASEIVPLYFVEGMKKAKWAAYSSLPFLAPARGKLQVMMMRHCL